MTASTSQFKERFGQRLQGLAASHDLLFTQDGKGAPLQDLIARHLVPFINEGDQRVSISCEGIMLKGDVIQSVGMALHELATNAVKYGALSVPTGKVSIRADRESQPDAPLTLCWTERDGPKVSPPTRTGFGNIVIDQMVAQTVDGKAELDYDAAGFSWTLTISRQHFDFEGALTPAR